MRVHSLRCHKKKEENKRQPQFACLQLSSHIRVRGNLCILISITFINIAQHKYRPHHHTPCSVVCALQRPTVKPEARKRESTMINKYVNLSGEGNNVITLLALHCHCIPHKTLGFRLLLCAPFSSSTTLVSPLPTIGFQFLKCNDYCWGIAHKK